MPYIDCDEAGCEEKALTGLDCWHDHWIPDPPETPEEVHVKTTETLTIPSPMHNLLVGEAALCSERYGFTVTVEQILERTIRSAQDRGEFAWDYEADGEDTPEGLPPEPGEKPIDLDRETKSRTALELAAGKYGAIKHPKQKYDRTRQLIDVLSKANIETVGQLIVALNSGVKIRGIAESGRKALVYWLETSVGVELKDAA